jgi:hypothetical protein
VPDAGSRVPSAGHVSAGPGLQFSVDVSDLDDVLGCTCCVRRTLQMASEPLQFLIPSLLVAIVQIWAPSLSLSSILANYKEEDVRSP